MLVCRGEREAWIKAKYIHHKFVSLDRFLRNFQNLDKTIIRNLARMKIYHEQKDAIARSDSKVKHLFRRKHAVKLHKAQKRKSAPGIIRASSDPFPDRANSSPQKESNALKGGTSQKNLTDSELDKHYTSSGEEEELPRRSSCAGDGTYSGDMEREHSRLRSASLSAQIFSQLDDFGDRRGSSSDSVPSEESTVSSVGEPSGEVDEEGELKEDREKAIHVLKCLHPNRVRGQY